MHPFFGSGSTLDAAGGAYSTSPDSLAGMLDVRGPTSKRREGMEGKGRGWDGKKWEEM